MRYRRSKAEGATFFFTVVAEKRERILRSAENARLLMDAFEHIRGRRAFTIDAFVLLPDHIHCIWTLPWNDNDFSTRWRLVKSYFSRRFADKDVFYRSPSRIGKGELGLWQRRFWEHTIRDGRDLQKHVEYIHYNPVKHGLVGSPRDWRYSSFHDYVSRGIYGSDWGAGGELVFEGVGDE